MTATKILKVSVLAGGELLLEGSPVTLTMLAQAIEQAAREKATIWYYRENAAGKMPPVAVEVINLITAHRLPVRLSSKPDFSDSAPDLGEFFAGVRSKAAQGQVMIVRPDGKHLLFPALKKESVPPDRVAAVEQMLPSKIKRNVAVIGDTDWSMAHAPSIQAASQAIPFLGLLMGFSSLGHAVWIFGTRHPAFINEGCRDADILIVDSACEAALPSGWQAMARKAMRNPQILVHDRSTYQLRNA
jgi:hypothetical protein